MTREADTLPVEIVFSPDWWHAHTGLTFDEDFFFHPLRRLEVEQRMESELHERFGRYGLGASRDQARPEVGAVHLAAGFLLSEMLGCAVEYKTDAPPQVIPASLSATEFPVDDPFQTKAWKRLESMMEQLETKCGKLSGDVNWSGVLNLALDLRGQELFIDMMEAAERAEGFFSKIARTIEEFTGRIESRTGTTSISVNRQVHNRPGAVFLHSECSHTMISEADYRRFLMPFDLAWSRSERPFGIHFCGPDPHRFAHLFAELPRLDFLDVGWGGDVSLLRRHLPNTFLNIRLDPVSIAHKSVDTIDREIRELVRASGDPARTGVCCINMDRNTPDENVRAIFETVAELRRRGNVSFRE